MATEVSKEGLWRALDMFCARQGYTNTSMCRELGIGPNSLARADWRRDQWPSAGVIVAMTNRFGEHPARIWADAVNVTDKLKNGLLPPLSGQDEMVDA